MLDYDIRSSELGFKTRVVNIFEENGIEFLSDLLKKSYDELRLFRNFGTVSEYEVRETLEKLGLTLRGHRSGRLMNPCPFCGHKREDDGQVA